MKIRILNLILAKIKKVKDLNQINEEDGAMYACSIKMFSKSFDVEIRSDELLVSNFFVGYSKFVI